MGNQRRNSKRIERRPTAIFDIETTAEIAVTKLKIQLDIRRRQQKNNIRLRLQNRHGFESSLLASSESDHDNNDIDSDNTSDMINIDNIVGIDNINNNHMMNNMDDNNHLYNNHDELMIRKINKKKSNLHRTKSKSKKLSRKI